LFDWTALLSIGRCIADAEATGETDIGVVLVGAETIGDAELEDPAGAAALEDPAGDTALEDPAIEAEAFCATAPGAAAVFAADLVGALSPTRLMCALFTR
jgi:hypothetical protein